MNQKAKEILGDYTEFYTLQAQRLQNLGIDIDGLEISHLAFRTETLAEYLVVRQKLEALCAANVENAWNGRPISKLLLQEPLQLSRSASYLLNLTCEGLALVPGNKATMQPALNNNRRKKLRLLLSNLEKFD